MQRAYSRNTRHRWRRKHNHRRRRRRLAPFVRGLILESLGVGVLVLLYVTLNTTNDSTAPRDEATRPTVSGWLAMESPPETVARPVVRWPKRFGSLSDGGNQPLPIGAAEWATWHKSVGH